MIAARRYTGRKMTSKRQLQSAAGLYIQWILDCLPESGEDGDLDFSGARASEGAKRVEALALQQDTVKEYAAWAKLEGFKGNTVKKRFNILKLVRPHPNARAVPRRALARLATLGGAGPAPRSCTPRVCLQVGLFLTKDTPARREEDEFRRLIDEFVFIAGENERMVRPGNANHGDCGPEPEGQEEPFPDEAYLTCLHEAAEPAMWWILNNVSEKKVPLGPGIMLAYNALLPVVLSFDLTHRSGYYSLLFHTGTNRTAHWKPEQQVRGTATRVRALLACALCADGLVQVWWVSFQPSGEAIKNLTGVLADLTGGSREAGSIGITVPASLQAGRIRIDTDKLHSASWPIQSTLVNKVMSFQTQRVIPFMRLCDERGLRGTAFRLTDKQLEDKYSMVYPQCYQPSGMDRAADSADTFFHNQMCVANRGAIYRMHAQSCAFCNP